MELWSHHTKYHNNSMKFHGTRLVSFQMTQGVIEFHKTLSSPNQMSPISLTFHGTSSEPFQMTPRFHGIFHGILWNYEVAKSNITEFHGNPWNLGASFQIRQGFHGIPLNISWNSMELCRRQVRCHKVPWNSMELWDYHFNWHQDSLWIFHETLELPHQMSPNLTEFHRTWWLLMQMASGFTGLLWNFIIKSMEFWSRHIEYTKSSMEFNKNRMASFQITQFSWNSMEYSRDFHGTQSLPN